MLFDGVLEPVDGALAPDRSAPGERARAEARGRAAVGGMIARLLRNVREGRAQRLLAATTALSAPALGAEIYFEHYKGSFGDKWMWTPLLLTPPLTAAGVAGVVSPRAARTALPLVSALYFARRPRRRSGRTCRESASGRAASARRTTTS